MHFGHDDGVTKPTALDDYEFDLRGFLVIRGALSDDEVAALNHAYDQFPELGHGEWYGNAQRRDYTSDTGFELHNVLDCGDPTFDLLIDHPSWVDHARRYAGEAGTYVQGITIDEHIATIREAGGHHPVHSGGHDASIRTQYAMRDGRFRCGQLNVLVALTDIGPGDGATMIVPGSHKANFPHPLAGDYARGDRMDALPFAVEVHANAGDALVFVDACMHGGSSRTTPGERRVDHPAVRTALGATEIRLHAVTRVPRTTHTRTPPDHGPDPDHAHRRHRRPPRPALHLHRRHLTFTWCQARRERSSGAWHDVNVRTGRWG